MRKVFCLGFGCTGTTTLHATAMAHGLRCIHDGAWARDTRLPAFADYVRAHKQPPPPGHPGCREFPAWQDYDFYSDGHHANFQLLDELFPDSYFILNTRSRYNWLTSVYNHLMRNRNDPHYDRNWLEEPTAEFMESRLRVRISYHRGVAWYFRKRDNFAVVDVEAEDESRVCEVLQTAIGQPVCRLHTANIHHHSESYEKHPPVVAQALKCCNIAESRWHLSLP